MADIVDSGTRSRWMSGIRGKDTKPEMLVRSMLHRAGYRFRIHVSNLPGRPDIVFKARKCAILIHGCFWHLHGCQYTKLPSSRAEFWSQKLQANRFRDQRNIAALLRAGWRVAIVWECTTREVRTLEAEHTLLTSLRQFLEVPSIRFVQFPSRRPRRRTSTVGGK